MHGIFRSLVLLSAVATSCAANAQEAIHAPDGYAPKSAVVFAGPDGKSRTASAFDPLPIAAAVLQPTLEERCLREGLPGQGYATQTAATGTIPVGVQNTGLLSVQLSYVGFVLIPDALTYSASPGGTFQIITAQDVNGRFPQWITTDTGPAGVRGSIQKPGFILRPFTTQNGVVSLNIRNNTSGTAQAYMASLAVTGCIMTDDFNFAAPQVLAWYGDSTCSTAATASRNLPAFVIRDWLRAGAAPGGRVHDIRLVAKCRSGSTTVDHELWRQSGWYNQTLPVVLGGYNVSINDAGNGVPPATYQSNLTAWWTWFHNAYPQATGIIFGTGPLANATSEAAAAALRTAAQQTVATINSRQLFFCNLGSAFVGTDTTKLPDGVHPNDAGYALEADAIKACMTAQNIVVPG